MRIHWTLTTILTALMLVSSPAAGIAQESGEAWLGGGSDLSSAVTVVLPQGASLPAIHHIFVDNPSDEAIEVEFRAEAPDGISIQPEWTERTVPAQGKVTNHFAVEVSAATAAGDYPVVVQLVRSDIEAVSGQVTNIPAVQAAFTVEVTGEASTVKVRGVSSHTGQPVSGTLVLEARAGDGRELEIDRLEGSAMESTVAPGDYRASFLLGEREVATEDFTVENGQQLEVVLAVETVAFVVAAARPSEENGRLVVVDLVASLNNEIPTIPGPVSIQTRITLDGTQVDLVVLRDMTELGPGLTEAAAQYRPDGGWQPGVYRFSFELATPDFTLTAADQSSLEVPAHSGWDLGGPLAGLSAREIIALAAIALLGIVAIERIGRLLIRGLRRHRAEAVASHHTRRDRLDDRATRVNRTKKGATTGDDSTSWLKDRLGPGAPVSPLAPAALSQATRLPVDTDHRPIESDGRRPEAATLSAGLPPKPPTPPRPSQNPDASPEARHAGTGPPGSAPSHNSQSADQTVAERRRTIQHLRDQGILSPGWSVSDATVVYSAVTSSGFQQALKATGMSHEDYKKVTAKLLRHGLAGRPPEARANGGAHHRSVPDPPRT